MQSRWTADGLGGVLLPHVDDDELEATMLTEFERTFGHGRRVGIPTGEVILREGEELDRIALVFDGRVELSRATEHGDVIVHGASTGPIIGLASLTDAPRTAFTVRAATDVEVLPLSIDELDQVLRADPILTQHFLNVLLRSLSRRHRHAVELQIENTHLARSLAADRDELARALAKLEDAQTQVVQSARMATLGGLAAGLAHELNNPIAAITRAAEHLADDTEAFVATCDDGPWRTRVLQRALTRPARSTAEQRRQRRVLTDELGDRRLAERLVAVGVHDPDEATRLLADSASARETLLEELERLSRLGDEVRNLRSAAGRIGDLVASLRAYARAGTDLQPGVDLREVLDDTLRLLNHRLVSVEVTREYGDVPTITGQPGELGQVATNLLSNALDAMDDAGALRLVVESVEGTAGDDQPAVALHVLDTGPGIREEDLERVFDPHFTTKDGRVTYGLGLGLSISHRIVRRHGGDIALRPAAQGGTEAVVVLPVQPPEDKIAGAADRADPVEDGTPEPTPSTDPAHPPEEASA